jgi:hypothetical protein
MILVEVSTAIKKKLMYQSLNFHRAYYIKYIVHANLTMITGTIGLISKVCLAFTYHYLARDQIFDSL